MVMALRLVTPLLCVTMVTSLTMKHNDFDNDLDESNTFSHLQQELYQDEGTYGDNQYAFIQQLIAKLKTLSQKILVPKQPDVTGKMRSSSKNRGLHTHGRIVTKRRSKKR